MMSSCTICKVWLGLFQYTDIHCSLSDPVVCHRAGRFPRNTNPNIYKKSSISFFTRDNKLYTIFLCIPNKIFAFNFTLCLHKPIPSFLFVQLNNGSKLQCNHLIHNHSLRIGIKAAKAKLEQTNKVKCKFSSFKNLKLHKLESNHLELINHY